MIAARTARAARTLTRSAFIVLAAACVMQATCGYFSSDPAGHATGSDDAFIAYRYVRNFVGGHGLVFNPGERVEGYSSLLYLLLLSPGFLVAGAERIFTWSVALNIAAALASLGVVVSTTRRQFGETAAVAVAWTVSVCPVFWMWTAAGLETPFVLLAQLAIWAAVIETVSVRAESRRLSVWSVIAVWLRPDGFIIPVVASVYLAARGRARAGIQTLLATLAATAVITAWRRMYYGEWLPNTYYAKVAGTIPARLDAAFHQFILIAPDTGLLVCGFWITAAVGTWWWERSRPKPVSAAVEFAALMAVALVGYWFYVGGDLFEERFLLVLFPLGAYAAVAAFNGIGGTAAVLALALLALIQITALNRQEARFSFSLHRSDYRILLGRYLREHHPGQLLAVDAAGKIPYFSELPTIDMLGLSDHHIARTAAQSFHVAHSRYDADYTLSRGPDLIAAFGGSGLDLLGGLTRQKYEQAGYRIKYLVNDERHQGALNIVDVDRPALDEAAIERLRRSGWSYVILARRD